MEIEDIIFKSFAAVSLAVLPAAQPISAEPPKQASSKATYRRFAAEASYIRPLEANHIDAPLPKADDAEQVVSIYGNILYPEDRELVQKKRIMEWMECYAQGFKSLFPISEEELKEVSAYILERIPKQTLQWHLAKIFESAERGDLQKTKEQALAFTAQYREIAQALPDWGGRCEILAQKLLECAEQAEKIIDRAISYPNTLGSSYPYLMDPIYQWDTRTEVLRQMVDKVTALSPSSPYFLALQEVTPQALSDLKKTFAERDLQWISFNNVSCSPTLEPRQEKVVGEATAFTSTIALSRHFHVQKAALGSLPTESGSVRKILGVRVLNENTHKTFDIFTTHTDHKIQNDIYLRTAIKIHQFVTDFMEDAPEGTEQPFVLGGDLNAFPGLGGDKYVEQLRELLPSAEDFRETDYYAPSPIAWSTFIGRPGGQPPINVESDRTVPPSGLDQLLLGSLAITAASREALVYNEAGELLDYYSQPEEYVENLRKKSTFSDHFFNIVRFK